MVFKKRFVFNLELSTHSKSSIIYRDVRLASRNIEETEANWLNAAIFDKHLYIRFNDLSAFDNEIWFNLMGIGKTYKAVLYLCTMTGQLIETWGFKTLKVIDVSIDQICPSDPMYAQVIFEYDETEYESYGFYVPDYQI